MEALGDEKPVLEAQGKNKYIFGEHGQCLWSRNITEAKRPISLSPSSGRTKCNTMHILKNPFGRRYKEQTRREK